MSAVLHGPPPGHQAYQQIIAPQRRVIPAPSSAAAAVRKLIQTPPLSGFDRILLRNLKKILRTFFKF